MGTGIRVDRERVPEVADHFARLFRQKMRGPCASRVEPVCGVRHSLSSSSLPLSFIFKNSIIYDLSLANRLTSMGFPWDSP